jgi:peptide/nickel transport system ATP-binding protein
MIELRRLTIGFPGDARGLGIAVRDLSLTVVEGERVGVVGESGSGKSLTALACLGLVPEPGRVVGGSILIEGRDLAAVPTNDLKSWRGGGAGFCFQEASSALNPVYTTGFQLEEAVRCHRGVSRSRSRDIARDLLEVVAVDSVDRILGAYPHQLSGGQAQRVMLALALAGDPRLLIADEPTSALDAVTRVEILDLLDRLVKDLGLALLLISHDLEVVRRVVDRVAVMYAGEIVEEAPTEVMFREPLHPYTQLLLASALGTGSRDARRAQPDGPRRGPAGENGCAFVERCLVARASCSRARPELVDLAVDRRLRCPVAAEASEAERVRI